MLGMGSCMKALAKLYRYKLLFTYVDSEAEGMHC